MTHNCNRCCAFVGTKMRLILYGMHVTEYWGVLPTVLRRCVWSRNIKNRCSIYIYIYIYDVSNLRVNNSNTVYDVVSTGDTTQRWFRSWYSQVADFWLLNALKGPGSRLGSEDMFVMVFLSPVPRSLDSIFTKATTSSAPSSLISHSHTFRIRRSLN